MKNFRLFSTLVAVLAAMCALADTPSAGQEKDRSSHAIIRLLNSRAAGSPRACEAAAKIVLAEAEAGKPLQRFVLALVSTDPLAPESAHMTEKKRREFLDSSRERIRLLAERKNNPLAWYLLSLETNDPVLLKRAADGGNVQALNAWGARTLTAALTTPQSDTNELERVLKTCHDCFKRASDQGDSNGLYNLGMCKLNGYGCEANENLAFQCFLTAAKDGHPEAINNLGGFYRDGIVVRQNLATAAKWFEKSAEYGNDYGELNFALALQRGEGVEQDEPRAAKLLKHAAEQGNVDAINAYGLCLFHGRGVDEDLTAAVAWFERAAALGNPGAMESLSECYAGGKGVTKSSEKSMIWKIRARAAAGDRNAAAWLKQNGYLER